MERKRILSFLTLWGSVSAALLLLHLLTQDYSVAHRLWANTPAVSEVCRDTGYGYQPLQCLPGAETGPGEPGPRAGLFLLLEVPRYRPVDAVRLRGAPPSLRIYDDNDGLKELEPTKREDGLLEAKVPRAKGRRPAVAWMYLLSGCLLAGAVLAGWAFFLADSFRRDRRFAWLGSSLLLSLLALSYFLYPGYLNSAEPLAMIMQLEDYRLSGRYSSLLLFLWSSLYEAWPGAYPYSLYLLQSGAFLLAVLTLLRRLGRSGWPFSLLAPLAIVLTLGPSSLESYFFLARAYSTDYITFTLAALVFTVLSERSPPQGRHLPFSRRTGGRRCPVPPRESFLRHAPGRRHALAFALPRARIPRLRDLPSRIGLARLPRPGKSERGAAMDFQVPRFFYGAFPEVPVAGEPRGRHDGRKRAPRPQPPYGPHTRERKK